jgi:hypothetical protein
LRKVNVVHAKSFGADHISATLPAGPKKVERAGGLRQAPHFTTATSLTFDAAKVASAAAQIYVVGAKPSVSVGESAAFRL